MWLEMLWQQHICSMIEGKYMCPTPLDVECFQRRVHEWLVVLVVFFSGKGIFLNMLSKIVARVEIPT